MTAQPSTTDNLPLNSPLSDTPVVEPPSMIASESRFESSVSDPNSPQTTDKTTADETHSKNTRPEKTGVTTSVKLTGRMLNFTRLQIQGDDLELIQLQLQKKLGQARQASPAKLHVLVSCNATLDLAKLWQLLWESGLQPIGLVTGVLDEQAIAQHIPIFPADGERLTTLNQPKSPSLDDVVASHPSDSANSSATPLNAAPQSLAISPITDTPATSLIQGDRVYTQIVRSGQSINHVGGDLILTNGINAGAEAITDYSLHVYGKAEGRLVAGATGDSNARIFCLRFNPSLVSVAGTYCLRENIPTEFLEKAVQVSYDPQKGLVFQLMSM